MTFTEAALEVLRLVGKPLHYKKITEVAIERNLLSHVGKTPEVTMSSRLATMVKKDRGDAPIIKVKPGVFGLREFSDEILKAAEHESGHDYELPPETEAPEAAGSAPAEKAGKGQDGQPVDASAKGDAGGDAEDGTKKDDEDAGESKKAASTRRLPGQEVFPEEDDDDEPIFGKPSDGDEDDDDDEGGSNRKKRRRRRRKKRDGADASSGGDDGGTRGSSEDDGSGSGRRRSRRKGRGGDGGGPSPRTTELRPKGDYGRTPPDGELVGRGLADAIDSVVAGFQGGPVGWTRLAEELVRRGRLQGGPAALGPTIAAAVRGDIASRRSEHQRPRFRVVPGGVVGTAAGLPKEALKAEQDAHKLAERQREHVRKAFLRAIGKLGTPGFVELIASWLNAEGVSGLRAVRPPSARPGEVHLAGTWRRGPEEVRLAIVVLRGGDDITRERVMEVRGALHHYAQASSAWMVTTGLCRSGGREEAVAPGTAPCALFDGVSLARAMERRGIGFEVHTLPILSLDSALLEALTIPRGQEPPPESYDDADDGDDDDDRDDDGSKKGSRRARGRRDDREASSSDGDDGNDSEAGGRPRRRRSRSRSAEDAAEASEGSTPRRRRRGGRTARDDDGEYGDDAAADDDDPRARRAFRADDDDDDDAGSPDPDARHRRGRGSYGDDDSDDDDDYRYDDDADDGDDDRARADGRDDDDDDRDDDDDDRDDDDDDQGGDDRR